MVIGTSQLRKNLLAGANISKDVCGSNVRDSESEPLLGLIVNNELTWSNYLMVIILVLSLRCYQKQN